MRPTLTTYSRGAPLYCVGEHDGTLRLLSQLLILLAFSQGFLAQACQPGRTDRTARPLPIQMLPLLTALRRFARSVSEYLRTFC